MAVVNENLLISLTNDLLIINKVNTEILQYVQPHGELKSWLHPNKTFSTESLKNENKFNLRAKNKSYQNLMENMLENLYVFINLLVSHFENFFEKKERLNRNVSRPANMSFGGSANLLWENVVGTTNNLLDAQKPSPKLKELEVNLQDVEIQTECYSLLPCASCGAAAYCINLIATEMELHVIESSTGKTKVDLRNDVLEITQNGCMNRMTVALIDDLRNILIRQDHLKNTNEHLRQEVVSLTRKRDKVLKIARRLEVTLKKTRGCLRKAKRRNSFLTRGTIKLITINKTTQKQLTHRRNKLKGLEQSQKENATSIALIARDNDRLQKDNERLLKENLNISNEQTMWKTRFSDMYLENRQLNIKLEEIESLNVILAKAEESCLNILEKLQLQLVEITVRTENFEKIIQEKSSSKRKPNGKKEDMFISKVQVLGNPVADMTRQIEENNKNIKKLEEYNINLLRTIHKVQATSTYT